MTHIFQQRRSITDINNDKAEKEHSHAISDITKLQSSLDGKSYTGHIHTMSEITDLEDLETTYAQRNHIHDTCEITDTTLTWTGITMLRNSNWQSVCDGNGKFVAIDYTTGSNIGAYSEDGINWKEISLPPITQRWINVCYGNDKFVAVPDNTKIAAYSTDGITWTQITMLAMGMANLLL